MAPLPPKTKRRAALTPPRKTFTDLPIQTLSIFDTVPSVNQALDELENGLFAGSSLVVDAMFRDDRIRGVTDTRINSLLGLPRIIATPESVGTSKVAGKIVEDLKRCFKRMFPRDQLAEMLRWGHFHSGSPVELIWEDWQPRIKVWHPLPLYWDWSSRLFRIATMDDSIVDIVPGDPKWMFYAPHGDQRGWMWGLARPLALPWLIRKFTYRDWSRYCEVHGMPIKKAVTSPSVKQEQKDRYRKSVSALGQETTIETMVNDKGEPILDLQLLEALANTYEGFQELIKQAEESVAICLLGQNLTTEVKGGSFAAAQVHDRVRADFLRFDAESLADALRDQVVIPWVRYNYDFKNAEEIAPEICWQTDPPEDKGDTAGAMLSLGQAITAFNTAGVAIDKKQVLEDFDVPYTGNAEMEPVVPGKTDQEGEGNEEQPPTEKETLARSTKPGWEKGQDYADKIADGAKEKGVQLVRPDLSRILGVIRKANSPAELKAGLLQAFSDMDTESLGRVLQRAAILARLDGRHSVLEDV